LAKQIDTLKKQRGDIYTALYASGGKGSGDLSKQYDAVNKKIAELKSQKYAPVLSENMLGTSGQLDMERKQAVAQYQKDLMAAQRKRYFGEQKRQLRLMNLRETFEKKLGEIQSENNRKAATEFAQAREKLLADTKEEMRVRLQNTRKEMTNVQRRLKEAMYIAKGTFSNTEANKSLWSEKNVQTIVDQLQKLNVTAERELRAINGLGTLTVGGS